MAGSVDEPRRVTGHRQVRGCVLLYDAVTLDDLDRVGAQPPEPGAAGGGEKRVQAGESRTERVDALFHWLVPGAVEVGFPRGEVLDRRWWIGLVDCRERCPGVD